MAADRPPEHNAPSLAGFVAPHRALARALLDQLDSAALGRVAKERLDAARFGYPGAQRELDLIGRELKRREQEDRA